MPFKDEITMKLKLWPRRFLPLNSPVNLFMLQINFQPRSVLPSPGQIHTSGWPISFVVRFVVLCWEKNPFGSMSSNYLDRSTRGLCNRSVQWRCIKWSVRGRWRTVVDCASVNLGGHLWGIIRKLKFYSNLTVCRAKAHRDSYQEF